MPQTLTLRVAEAAQKDIGFSIARIDPSLWSKLGAETGDAVEIHGPKKSTAALLGMAHDDEGPKNTIRIEALLRRNAGVSIGDKVTVRKIACADAERISVAPISSEATQINMGPGLEDYLARALTVTRKPMGRGDIFVIPGVSYRGGSLPFVVLSTVPKGFVQVRGETELGIRSETVPEREIGAPQISYEDIGGLRDKLDKIREIIEIPLKHPELFERLSITPPKGVLLYGPPGTGKTLIAKAVASEAGAYFISIAGPEIISKYYGDSEKILREKFEEAEKNSPSVVFIDELDSIAPRRDEVQGEVERRVVATLLTLMDGLSGRGNVIVIGATNREEAIDPALRRPGRFDREIEIGVPTTEGRREILVIHTRGMPIEGSDKEREELMTELSKLTHGFVGADLASLSREAAMHALRRFIPDMDFDKPISQAFLEKIRVKRDDFREALKSIEPSSLRDVLVEVPSVQWTDVGGLESVKRDLRESVELPFTRPEAFKALGITPPRGILLYGPPGTGKTLLAKAIATESQANFIVIKGPELMSKWVGETEKAIRMIFKKARAAAPAIVLIDEIDSIAPRRGMNGVSGLVNERAVDQLLTSIDGLESLEGVVIIGATNRPDMLDEALMRTGRFDRLIYVTPPDAAARLEILKVHTRKMPVEGVDLGKIAEATEGFVGSDLASLCKEAGMQALREGPHVKKVSMAHFEAALANAHASVSQEFLQFYEEFGKSISARSQMKKGNHEPHEGIYR
jgi:transitional endoplasmic reticulum ATPase